MSTTTKLTQEPPTTPSPSQQAPIVPSQPTQTSETQQLRKSRPSQVQTHLPVHSHSTALHSAISYSSVASSPQHGSPVMSPDPAAITRNSSIQASPEPMRGREDGLSPLLDPSMEELPEPLLSRKTSTNSLPHSFTSDRQEPTSKSGNIIRRISNRAKTASSKFRPSARRQSSTHPISRDASVGPGVIRRPRSDSGNTLPADVYSPAVVSESEDEPADATQLVSMPVSIQEGEATRNFSPTSAAPSITGSATPPDVHAGPVIPQTLLRGNMVTKVSKKSKKRITLVLDAEAGKIWWDKNRPSKCVYIDDIKETRIAPDIRQYRIDCNVPESEEPRFLTIIYDLPNKKHKTMHLIADDDEAFENWRITLDALSKHREDLMSSLMAFDDKAIQAYWRKEMSKITHEDPSHEDEIDFPGVERVCRNLHIHVSSEKLKSKFDEADKTRTSRLNFAEFQGFVRLMKRREDIRAVHQEIASDPERGMTFRDFASFMEDVQGESTEDKATWEDIFLSKAVENGDLDGPRMSEGALASYLTSNYNTPLKAAPKDFVLDRPMNEYFISSSHNTYLLGRQVAGISSVEGYITALMRGCRCVEVDCWNGPDNQPIVVHGNTLTSRIHFRETISAINKYAFIKSPYPLWISLEVHCNPIQQEIMANTMIEIFGDKLVRETLEGVTDHLPTPSDLMGRILIKVKKPALDEPSQQKNGEANGRKRGNSLTSPFAKPATVGDSSIPNSPLLGPNYSGRLSSRRVNTITEGEIPDAVSSGSSDDSGDEKNPAPPRQSKIIKVLGDLGVYCSGHKFKGFDDPDCRTFNHILSFKETTFSHNSSTKASKDALFRHNMRYLMRLYPSHMRLLSDNFDPLPYWKRGVQMAALNWQTFDHGMQLNQAMFAGGADQSGYVLKPSEFRGIQMIPNYLVTKRERKTISFSIDVISAQQLMRPVKMGDRRTVDPYVEVEVFIADDKRDKQESNGQPLRTPLKYSTQIIRQNGFNPIFDKKFPFHITTKYPDLVFIRWSVKLSEGGNYNDRTPVATYTAKLNNLKQGFRTLPLLDPNGYQYLFSTLFCRIKVEPITSVYVDYDGDGNVNKLKSLGRNVFNRSSNMSPKSSMDSGLS